MFINNDLLAMTPSPYLSDKGGYINHTNDLYNRLSEKTKDILKRLERNEICYFQFMDVPVSEKLPLTISTSRARIVKSTFQTEGVIGALAAGLGRIFSYKEINGHLLHDICAVEGLEYSNSAANSKNILSFHSDGASHPVLCPDYVFLYCLRSDPVAHNLIAQLDSILDVLPDKVVDVLKQSLFKHVLDEDLDLESHENYVIKPILMEEDGTTIIKYDDLLTVGINNTAKTAIEQLDVAISNVAVKVRNFPNSVIVMNNKKVVHARSAFTPTYCGYDRWIQSAYVSKANIENGAIIFTQ